MLKDITLGQYYPTGSIIHRLDPRTKLHFTLIYIIMLFLVNSFWGMLVAVCTLAGIVIASKIPFGTLLKGLKAIILVIVITVLINLITTQGTAVYSIGPITITEEGIRTAAFTGLRLILLILGTNIMTLTTTPIELTDAMESSLSHLPFIRRYAHELAMIMSIALRFIPTLIGETDKIIVAQKSRGADFETGNIIRRAKALIPILIPLFINAFRRADELATAMEARCYRPGGHRTRMTPLKYSKCDAFSYVILAVFVGAIFITRYTLWTELWSIFV